MVENFDFCPAYTGSTRPNTRREAASKATKKPSSPVIRKLLSLSVVVFLLVAQAAFGQRRKMLRNPLKGMFTPETLQEDIFTKRPEQLSVADFAALTFKMK